MVGKSQMWYLLLLPYQFGINLIDSGKMTQKSHIKFCAPALVLFRTVPRCSNNQTEDCIKGKRRPHKKEWCFLGSSSIGHNNTTSSNEQTPASSQSICACGAAFGTCMRDLASLSFVNFPGGNYNGVWCHGQYQSDDVFHETHSPLAHYT